MFELNGFYNMDCMEGLKQFPDKYFDLAIVDPQYGIDTPKMSMGTNKHRRKNGYASTSTTEKLLRSGADSSWDSEPSAKEYFQELFRVSQNQIIWGGNYFDLPPTRCVICWDKLQPWDAFSQWEMAWTSFDRPAKMYRISNTGGSNGEEKICCAQKPVALYRKCLTDFAPPGYKILDTHVGSASSLIACYEMGYDYIGFEKDCWTYRKARNRLEAFQAQQSLFRNSISVRLPV
ncbi:DNA methyltransferase [Clostridium sp. KNHs216]|uniref:DNA methyltransferase n=1 Tax=Clostridium sp. KNHs216 TaxID=1550235 RepID=UPI00114E8D25|nr:DNA methyltransferase [Clostridium sp. KNHs216]TQI68547.1 site-specific DNA-methyltransferase (adenine-specific) [Clostridium sp. KNHs216]